MLGGLAGVVICDGYTPHPSFVKTRDGPGRVVLTNYGAMHGAHSCKHSRTTGLAEVLHLCVINIANMAYAALLNTRE